MATQELTHDQHVTLNQWAQYGAAMFCDKVGRGWLVTLMGFRVPGVFKTKREAMTYVDEWICLKSREWRGIGGAV